MSGHDLLSPSASPRWTACPGSVREEAKYPEPERSGPAAIDGTHSHTLLEHCVKPLALEFGPLGDPLAMVGVTMKDHDGEFTVDRERAERVKVATEYVASRLAEGAVVRSESRVNPARVVDRDDMAGTLDLVMTYGDTVEIADFKDGMYMVSPETPQLKQYAIALMPFLDRIKKVRLTIIQPKLAFKGMPAITSSVFSVEDAYKWVDWFKERAAATDDPNAPLVPGELQCKYCRAKPCSAMAEASMKEVGMLFKPMAEIAEQSADTDPATMDSDRLRQIIEAAPLLRQLIEGAEAEALRRAQSGVTIPGLKLVYGRGSTSWAQDEDKTAEVLRKMGVPKDAVYVTKVVSPAQAKKLTWAKRDGTVKQLSERQLKTLEAEYIVKMGGKLTIVAESDSRPAVVLDASPMFQAVEAPAAPEAQASLPAWLM